MEANDPIAALLLPGERIQWRGRPSQGVVFSSQDFTLIPFSLLWCAFMIYWETTALRSGGPWFFSLFGGAFVLAGLYFVFGRFVIDILVRRVTTYALTDKRMLICRTAPFGSFMALNLDRLPTARLLPKSGGRGTIRFGEGTTPFTVGARRGPGSWAPSLDPTPQFIAIDQASSVFQLVQRLTNARERG